MAEQAERDQPKRRQDAPPLFADQDRPGGELAVPATGVLEGDVVEGEVVDDQPPEPRTAAATIRVVVTDVATHPHTKTVARHVLYVAVGASVAVKRLWDGRTTARYERMMRSAEATGNHESALEWEARAATFRRDRHSRRMDLVALPGRVVAALPKVALGVFALLLALGVLLAVANAVKLAVVVVVVGVAWGPLVLAVPWVVVVALWSAGRGHASASSGGWVTRLEPERPDAGIVVTTDTIVVALQHLRIPELKRAAKDGWSRLSGSRRSVMAAAITRSLSCRLG